MNHHQPSSIENLPKHVAIIMDGNGRWAQKQGRTRIEGHSHGAARVREIVEESVKLDIRCLTLYAFSEENWKRPGQEVDRLMELLITYLQKELQQLMEQGIRLNAIGNLERLPNDCRNLIASASQETKDNTGMILTLALSYSGRSEIVRAVKQICQEVTSGNMKIDAISEGEFEHYLQTAHLGDPDLLIRTSGEKRLSNFLLWQAAYTELYFTPTYWPDFTKNEFRDALENYSKRQRRFGNI